MTIDGGGQHSACLLVSSVERVIGFGGHSSHTVAIGWGGDGSREPIRVAIEGIVPGLAFTRARISILQQTAGVVVRELLGAVVSVLCQHLTVS